MYEITKRPLPIGKRRSGKKLDRVVFLVAHDTGNPGSTAKNNVDFYTRTAQDESASAHFFVDDISIVECVPSGFPDGQAEKAWHVGYGEPEDNLRFGDDANDCAIGIEYCHGPKINADEAYARYVWLHAQLCVQHGLNPITHIAGHFQLDPKRRTDPNFGLNKSGRTFEGFLKDVASSIGLPETHPTLSSWKSISPLPMVTSVSLKMRSSPSTSGIFLRTCVPGTPLYATRVKEDGEAVKRISRWYGNDQGVWWWSGGVQAV